MHYETGRNGSRKNFLPKAAQLVMLKPRNRRLLGNQQACLSISYTEPIMGHQSYTQNLPVETGYNLNIRVYTLWM